ncbi:MAG: hypothetical protein JRN24_01715 [Nitrososphaerota archaeon]|nr:hypothetical protein [Nitrososphaerota archaeon]
MSQSEVGSAGSVSRVQCSLAVRGRGEARLSIYRHLAPLTVNAVLRTLPIESRVSVQPAMVSLFTQIRVGVEKPRTNLVRGDVAFLASGGLICVFLKAVTSDRPLNPLGRIDSGQDTLDGVRPGDVIRVSLLAQG